MAQFAVNDGTGFSMNYEVHPGLAPETTLFIHGNLASNRWWYPSLEFFKQQARGHNYAGSLIFAEFRGCGLSSAPKSETEVNMHTFANDFIALVRSLKLAPINLVGHSTGGLIVALMLAKAPELFNKALLLDPVGAQGVKFDNNMIAAFEQMKASRDLVAVVMGATIYNNNPDSEYFNNVLVADAFTSVKSVGHLVLKALDGLDTRHEVAKVPHPVMVLHGEHDTLLEMQASRDLAQLMKNAQFAVISGQGHCSNVEAPEKFVSQVKSFLF